MLFFHRFNCSIYTCMYCFILYIIYVVFIVYGALVNLEIYIDEFSSKACSYYARITEILIQLNASSKDWQSHFRFYPCTS